MGLIKEEKLGFIKNYDDDIFVGEDLKLENNSQIKSNKKSGSMINKDLSDDNMNDNDDSELEEDHYDDTFMQETERKENQKEADHHKNNDYLKIDTAIYNDYAPRTITVMEHDTAFARN